MFLSVSDAMMCVDPSWQKDFGAKELYNTGRRKCVNAQAFSFMNKTVVTVGGVTKMLEENVDFLIHNILEPTMLKLSSYWHLGAVH